MAQIFDRKSVHIGEPGKAVDPLQACRSHHALRLSWRLHSACGYLAAKTARRSWDEANSFGRLFQKHRLQTCTAQPVVFNATGTFAVPAHVPERHIEHKNAALTQVVERFCALWIGAMIHHAGSLRAGRRLQPRTVAVLALPTNTVGVPAGPSPEQLHLAT